MAALIEAKEVVAGYLPGVNILNGCNLYANEGDLVGIIGPNGAGKSTLLKSLFGLVKVREGHVTFKGNEITNKRADELVQMGIGFVPQSNNVFPSLTIEENLQIGAFRSPDKYEERAEYVMGLFPTLAKRKSQKAGSLSLCLGSREERLRRYRQEPCGRSKSHRALSRHSGPRITLKRNQSELKRKNPRPSLEDRGFRLLLVTPEQGHHQ